MRLHRWLIVAILIGLAIRIPLLIKAQDDGVPGDQLQYSAQAHTNANGRWYEQPFVAGDPAAEHPPLTSAVLTPPTWVFRHGNFVLAQRLTILTFGILNIVLLCMLGRRYSHPAGSAAALLAAIDVHLFLGDVLVFSETFLVTLMTLFLLILLPRPGAEHARETSRRQLGVAGLLMGLLLLTRAELLVMVPLVSLLLWWYGPSRRSTKALFTATIPALVALLVVAPWVAWNMSRFDATTTLSTNDGFTFLGTNCPDTYFGDNIGGYSINCALSVLGTADQDASVVSAARRRAAQTYAREHLGRIPLVVGARFLRQWELGWIGRTAADSPGEGRSEPLVLLGTFQWWIYAALAVIGIKRVSQRTLMLLMIAPIVVTISGIVVIAQWRVRAAAEPMIVLLAALGIGALLERRRLRDLRSWVEPVGVAGPAVGL